MDDRIRFIFGYDAKLNLVDKAYQLPQMAWKPLHRRQAAEQGKGSRAASAAALA